MRYKLSEINNLRSDDSGKISGSVTRNISEAITCIMCEYAIGFLKYDNTDESLYPFIQRYFAGEYRTKEMLAKLLNNYEIREFFSMVTGIEKLSVDSKEWRDILDSISLDSNKTNDYIIGEKEFSVDKLFVNIMISYGEPIIQRYYLADKGVICFSEIGNDDNTTEISNPYGFAGIADSTSPETIEKYLDDKDFFNIEEVVSTDSVQRKVIRASTEKNLVVLAGAGSGKTRILVSRLAYLHLVKSIPLSKMVLLTFTKAAANEMRRRAEALIGSIYSAKGIKKHPYVYAKTFDAFFRRILLDYYAEIGFSETPVLELDATNDNKKISMLKDVIRDNQMQGVFSDYLSDDNGIKILLQQMEQYAIGIVVNQPGVDRLLDLFLDSQIRSNTVLGFLYVNQLVKQALSQENSQLKAALLMKYSCILIDEFQDISVLQNETLKPFYNTDMHFSFVGDDDQSIYAWRGADIGIIQEIVKDENTDTQYLLTNYRNNPNIVKAGNCILKLIQNRAKKNEIIPYKTSGSKIRVANSDSKYSNVVDEIDRLIKNGCDPNEIAVLARKTHQAQQIMVALKSIKIPVATQEIRITLDAYYGLLKALVNIWSDYDVYRSCKAIKDYTKTDGVNETEIYRVVRGVIQGEGNLQIIQDISLDVFRDGAEQLSVIVDRYAEKIGEEFLGVIFGRMESESLESFSDFCKNGEVPWPVSHSQLRAVYLTFERNNGKKSGSNERTSKGVCVSTIHHSKGLEYNVVMIIGLNQGEYPNIWMIDKEYERKVKELDKLKNARSDYYSLRDGIADALIDRMIYDSENASFSIDEKERMKPISEFISKKKNSLKQLRADTIEEFQELYSRCIIPIERRYSFEHAKVSRNKLEYENELRRKNEEQIISPEDDRGVDKEIEEIKKRINDEDLKLESIKSKEELFEKSIFSLKGFNNTAYIASGLLEDMNRAEELETIKEKLEKEKSARISEERRTFYVAVTRARDHLYMFTDEGNERSEFVDDIDAKLKTEYKALTRNEYTDLERMSGALKSEFKNEKIDESSVFTCINSIVNHSMFKEYIDARLKNYYLENPLFTNLGTKSQKYFDQALGLLFVSELIGIEFKTEIAHNIQRTAECVLHEAEGEKAIPYSTSDKKIIEGIIKSIRENAKKCSTKIPSKKFIENTFSKNSIHDKLSSLKRGGIQHFVVRSGLFSIDSHIMNTWKKKEISGNADEFLTAILDLSNIRNVLIHENENSWPEDAITSVLENLKVIIKSNR